MTALDSLEHLPNHACYEKRNTRRIHEEKHLVICLDQSGTIAEKGKKGGRCCKNKTVKKSTQEAEVGAIVPQKNKIWNINN